MALTKIVADVADIPKLSVALNSDTTAGGLTNTAKIYDIAGSVSGKPGNAAVVARFVAVRAFSLPAGLTGSFCKAGTAATASSVLTINKNGSSVGTMTFAIAGTTASLAMASQTSFAAGDILTVVAPGTADSTLADIQFTLAGSLT